MKIVPKSLPLAPAIKHMNATISFGGGGDSAISEKDLATNSIYAFVPEDTQSDALLKFEHGGLLELPPKIQSGRPWIQSVPNTAYMIASVLSEELALSEKQELWIHEPLFTEREVMKLGMPYTKLDNKIYLVSKGKLDVAHIAGLIQWSLQSWHFLCWVVEGQASGIENIKEVITNANFLVVGAYDGESFLYAKLSMRPSSHGH